MRKFTKYWPIKITVFLFIGLFIFYILFNQSIAQWAYPGSENRNGELLKDFLSISGGLAIIAGLYLTFLRSKAIEETVKNQQIQIKNQQTEIGLTRDSNLNEQFKNAVEHLGSEKEPIILGGVAELNQLATNQPDKFAPVVLNIYSSYCKSEAHYKKNDDDIKESVIRAIINNLCNNSIYKSFRVDLSYTNLFSISLQNCHIEGWDLSYSKLPHKALMVYFKNCNFNHSSGFLTNYTDVNFEDCNLYKVFLEQGRWYYPVVKGNSKLSLLALDSEFHALQVKSELLYSLFINCSIKHTTFDKGFLSSTDFLCCRLEKVSFRNSEMMSNRFDGSEMNQVLFRGFVSSSTFRGVKKAISNSENINLYSSLTYSLNKESDLSGVSFQGMSKNIDSCPLTEYDAYHISNKYNKIVEKYAVLKNFKIRIPEEWKEAAKENGTFEEQTSTPTSGKLKP